MYNPCLNCWFVVELPQLPQIQPCLFLSEVNPTSSMFPRYRFGPKPMHEVFLRVSCLSSISNVVHEPASGSLRNLAI
jgi:hypothetical protein